ncbi:MAG TPA: protease pro-enzyme activation domain-containing protein [Thermoanaerobaculia bacterium]|nr:protease pro-enzyme activation domain-containing protein [Thermoanaerobaculia bacterium]
MQQRARSAASFPASARLSLALLAILATGGALGAHASSARLAAAVPPPAIPAIPAIIEDDRVPLPGNVHPLARPELEVGPTDPDLPMQRIILVLGRRRGAAAELARLLDEQQDPASPSFHRWLTPEEFGRRFGISDDGLGTVAGWLGAHGFSVDEIARGRGWIQFSGTTAQVAEAFRTPIRDYQMAGRTHHANAAEPSMPRTLSPLVAGIVSLHDFPRPLLHRGARPAVRRAAGEAESAGSQHFLAPADFATIYDVKPLYAAGVTGSGVKIAIVGRSDLNLGDVQYFRSHFGLPANDPVIIHNGTPPGDLGGDEEMEADLDVQWSGAVAPGATIDFVVSASAFPSDGFDLSAAYIVDHALAPIVSASYGSCEASMSAGGLAFYDGLWAQAAAQGISVFVAAGDFGAAVCAGRPTVSDVCATPYDVCVGGTQLDDHPASSYWAANPDTATQGSALSYIPEVAWNEAGIGATGGGASAVYPKPRWQAAPGVPDDGRRDVPDVALTAAVHDGYMVVIGHGASATGLMAVGGTSAASPSFAGLMALVVQKTGRPQGNANPTLYKMGSAQYGGGGPAVFHDVTAGNNSYRGVSGGSCGSGYDPVTGLGSVDANALVNNWSPAGAPDFGLEAQPADLTLAPGNSITLQVQLASFNSFQVPVALALAGVPAGVTASFNPATVSGAGSSTLTLTAAAGAATGFTAFTLTGSGGGLTHSVPVGLRLLLDTARPALSFSVTPSALAPIQLAAGPDGAVWFTAISSTGGGDRIGRVTTGGTVTEFSLPSCAAVECFPLGIVAGPDGALWFTEADVARIGRITTSGSVSEFALPAGDAQNGVPSIAAGSDGALWFLENGPAPKVGRITTAGAITEFPLPTADRPAPGISLEPTIAAGPDGALWFTEVTANKIGRITTSGQVAEYAVPTPQAGVTTIVAAPDGALWFAESAAMKIGRITTAGAITEFATGFPYVDFGYGISALAVGPDGNLWFTGYDRLGRGQLQPLLGRLTLSGGFTWFLFVDVVDLALGSDGNLWYISGTKIGRFALPTQPAPCSPTDSTLCLDGQPGDHRFQVQVAYQTAAGSGLAGSGHAIALAPVGIAHGGAFWFFSADNPEMLVKVIDGCGVDGNQWFFASAGTNVGMTITLTDTRSGARKIYRNPDGNAAVPIQDTAALSCSSSPATGNSSPPIGEARQAAPPALEAAAAASARPAGSSGNSGIGGSAEIRQTAPAACAASDTTLCIDGRPGDRRFQVQVAYHTTEGGGLAGSGHALPLAPVGIGHGGAFWFFSADNPEMLVKVVNGCGLNNYQWFFASAGTNVGLTITVTDTQTGAQKIYRNPDNAPAQPIQDTSAFPSCP